MEGIPNDKKIILFDGVCNLCNSSVQYVIKHDKKDVFRFVAIQSELGQKIIEHIGISQKNIDSVIFYKPGKVYYYKSTAALEIAKCLGGVFTYAAIFRIIPSVIRDFLYDYIAKNRYKWYGKKENCLLPSAAINTKFLS